MQAMMLALVKEDNNLSIRSLPRPEINSADEILIKIICAGICRTDIYVAQGSISACNPIIIGHEFAGVIEQIGVSVTNFSIGDRVTVMPIMPCHHCQQCRENNTSLCQQTGMLGVDHNGAFAEYIVVPQSIVYRLPEIVSFQLGAYIEPIAAALAVLKTGIKPQQRGLIYGENRIAKLIKMILQAHQFANVTNYQPDNIEQSLPDNHYDFIIETLATSESLRAMIRAIKPQGKIILKSRQYRAIEFDLISAIKKEVILQAVNYGSFDQAIELAASGSLSTSELFGDSYRLTDYQAAFQAATASEAKKIFFTFE